MGFVRCRFISQYESNPILSDMRDNYSHRTWSNILRTWHIKSAIHNRIKFVKRKMALRERIQRRFPPKIGRFLL